MLCLPVEVHSDDVQKIYHYMAQLNCERWGPAWCPMAVPVIGSDYFDIAAHPELDFLHEFSGCDGLADAIAYKDRGKGGRSLCLSWRKCWQG